MGSKNQSKFDSIMEPQNLYYQEINLNPKIIANRNQYYLIVMKRLDK